MGLYGYAYNLSAHLLVTNEDAGDFLQSQFSNDLRPFSPGQAVYGLWLDVKGKIQADGWVFCEGAEKFHIFSEHGAVESIQEKLEQHIIADDVELEAGPLSAALAVMGEDAGELAASATGALVLPGRRFDLPSVELVFESAAARDAWVSEQDIEIVSEEWIQNERMQSGISTVGCEALPGDLPGEAALVEDAISFKKGCFLGQEVVARMHNVGRPQRALYIISGEGELPQVSDEVSTPEGKLLGALRTCHGGAEGWQGVALLKSRFVEPGAEVRLNGKVARVNRLYASGSRGGRSQA